MDPRSKEDRSAAILQALTGDTELQYDDAYDLIEELSRQYGKSNMIVVGSSLGGGVGAYAGSQLGIETVTFNAAGVHLIMWAIIPIWLLTII